MESYKFIMGFINMRSFEEGFTVDSEFDGSGWEAVVDGLVVSQIVAEPES